jgi:pimeloyl-ACP methyl ester carboxylesterase
MGPGRHQFADSFWVITPDSRGHGRSTNPRVVLSYQLIADDVAALVEALGLERPVVGGWSDGGQVALELGARHPGPASALIVGAAYPDFEEGGLRAAHRALLGADDEGIPDPDYLDAELGEFAEEIKALHPGGAERRQSLVRQTAPMWLDDEGLGPDEVEAIQTPVLVLAGDRDDLTSLDLAVSLYRAHPRLSDPDERKAGWTLAVLHAAPASFRAFMKTGANGARESGDAPASCSSAQRRFALCLRAAGGPPGLRGQFRRVPESLCSNDGSDLPVDQLDEYTVGSSPLA